METINRELAIHHATEMVKRLANPEVPADSVRHQYANMAHSLGIDWAVVSAAVNPEEWDLRKVLFLLLPLFLDDGFEKRLLEATWDLEHGECDGGSLNRLALILVELIRAYDLDAAREEKAVAERERELADLRDDFGDYWKWSERVVRYFLDEFADGCWEDDDVTILLGAGASMARADLDRDPKSALNAMWMAADVLLNLYDEDLDEEARKAAEAVWDATCKLARPECGYHRSHPFTGEVFELQPQDDP